MSCPDWFSLVTRRDDEPERWERALEHHDSCDRCREEALDAEPTLLFQRRSIPDLSRQDIADIKQAVATMRRTLPLAESPDESAPLSQHLGLGPGKALRSRKNWLRAAALGAILLGATWFEGSLFKGPNSNDGSATNLASLSTAPSEVAELHSPAAADGNRFPERTPPDFQQPDDLFGQNTSFEELPLVEDADPSYGSIVEVVGQDISFVLVLPSLDV